MEDRKEPKRMAKATVGGVYCVWPNPMEAVYEITEFLKDGCGEMRIEIIEMSMEEFDELPEFDGF